jgi:hypothetical protein
MFYISYESPQGRLLYPPPVVAQNSRCRPTSALYSTCSIRYKLWKSKFMIQTGVDLCDVVVVTAICYGVDILEYNQQYHILVAGL